MQPASPHIRFWQWFKNNGERLRTTMYGTDEAARDNAAAELREAIESVEEGLVLEFGTGDEGQPNPLIVSADGKPDKVDAVKDFVASAPALPGWTVVAFRPRMDLGEDVEIALEGERVGPEDIFFRVEEGDDGLDLTLYVRGLTPANQRLRGLGASLLAEHAVGERDALTMLSSLQIQLLPKATAAAGLRPFGELVGVFDRAKRKKYPPPGSLTIDFETDWQNMRGTINDAPALILLHAGLRRVAGHPDYDRRLTVSLPLNDADEDGMPGSKEEYVAVSDLGDRLREVLQEGQQSLLVMTLMTQGRRDLILYTSDAEAALERLEAAQAEGQTHRIEPAVERDTFWGMYRSFAQAGDEEDEEDEDEEDE